MGLFLLIVELGLNWKSFCTNRQQGIAQLLGSDDDRV